MMGICRNTTISNGTNLMYGYDLTQGCIMSLVLFIIYMNKINK